MSEITLGELEASIKSLKLDAGLEAFNFVNTAGTFFTKVKQYFITAAPETKKALVKADFSPILKAYGHYNYTDFMERPVFQPARLAISYHEWLDVLNVLAAYCTYVETDLLPSTLTWMAELSVGKASVAYAPKFKKELYNKVEGELGKALSGKDVTTAPFGDRFSNLLDFKNVYVEFNNLATLVGKTDVDAVSRKVTRLSEVVSALQDAIATKTITLDRHAVDNVSNTVLNAARAVDLYSICITLLITTGAALSNTALELKQKMKA